MTIHKSQKHPPSPTEGAFCCIGRFQNWLSLPNLNGKQLAISLGRGET